MQMKARMLTAAVAAMLLLSGCHREEFTLQGTLEGGAGRTLWLEELSPEGGIFIDSIPVDASGHFKCRVPLPYPSFYNLHTSAENYVVLLPGRGERIEVEGRWENLSLTYTVEGSPESVLLWDLQQQSNACEQVVSRLVDTSMRYAALRQRGLVSKADSAAKKRETDSIFRQTRQEMRTYVYDFLEDNQGSLSTLIALYKPFNGRPLIDSRDSACVDWYVLVAEGLEARLPDNPHTLHFLPVAERVRMAYQAVPQNIPAKD